MPDETSCSNRSYSSLFILFLTRDHDGAKSSALTFTSFVADRLPAVLEMAAH
jgi:hypothetical protein